MARGFDTTFGSGTTDKIASALATIPTTVSFLIYTNRNGEGGSGFGRIIEVDEVGGGLLLFNSNGLQAATYGLGRESAVPWYYYWTRPSASVWSRILITIDRSGSAAPVVYQDGSTVTVNISGVNAGWSSGTPSTPWTLGNRNVAANRVWNGLLAEFAVWNVILTAAEGVALTSGACSPLLVRPASLQEYTPTIRDNISLKLGAATITGTAVQPHPPVFRLRKRKFAQAVSAAAGAFIKIVGTKFRLAGQGGLVA
jgi:hypothetical protein